MSFGVCLSKGRRGTSVIGPRSPLPFARLFQESGVRVVISAASRGDHEPTSTRCAGHTGNELDQDMKQVSSGRVADDDRKVAHFRVLRFLCDSVVVDAYTDRTLPSWLSLNEANVSNANLGGEDVDDDDASSDDSFSTDTEEDDE